LRATRSRARTAAARAVPVAVVALAACSPPPPPPADSGPADADAAVDAPPGPPPRVCRAGTSWSPGAQAFQENTAAWGLAGLNGTNPGVPDIDNDGWPDLVLAHGSPYDRTPGQVFVNRPGPDGRRTFVEQSAATRLFAVRDTGEPGRSANYVAFGDVDNDGDL